MLITGAATGIGNPTARALAAAGHTVYATMRDPEGRNSGPAGELVASAEGQAGEVRVLELDVTSQDSTDAAVAAVLERSGRPDVAVHNAGHLVVGYTEAFTAEDVAHLFDTNAISVQRLNRAVLPHMRERGSGVLLYVGSTTTVVVPPSSVPTSPRSSPSTRWPR